MKRKSQRILACFSCLLLIAIAFATGSRAYGQGPKIKVTAVPHVGLGGSDLTELISGSVTGVDFFTHKIVIYAFAGGTWWVQPTSASPYTSIDKGGAWQTITHLGSVYAILVVNNAYKPPATTTDTPNAKGDILKVELIQGR
jgi:hypothetical protein